MKDKIITILLIAIPSILFIAFCGFAIYLWIVYKDQTIEEIPNWVRWIMG